LSRASAALADFDFVLVRHPDWAQTHNYRGVALSALTRLDEAVAAFGEALHHDPDYRDAHLNRAIVYERLNKIAQACDDYRAYLSTPSDQRQVYLTLARLLESAGKTHEAEHWLDQAVSRFPNDPKAHFHRAVLHYNLGDWEHAIAGFSEALRYEPSGLTEFWRGNAYLELGNHQVAARDYLAAETAGIALPAKARTLAHSYQASNTAE
jgi:tetratricopeptide (TPR) repeat protein